MGRFAPIASSFRLEVEANLPQNKDENEDSTNLEPWGFVFGINTFPDFTRILPSNHR